MTTHIGWPTRPGLPDEPAAFDRLVSDYCKLLRRDVPDKPQHLVEQAARILAEGARRRVSGDGQPYQDEKDVDALRYLFWPESGQITSRS